MILRLRSAICLAAGLTGFACAAARAESAFVVKITAINESVTCEAMSREDLAKLKQQVQAEARVFPTALANVEKAWKADENNKGTPFVSSRVTARKVQESGPFDLEVAQKKAASLAERAIGGPKDDGKSKKRLSDREREKEAERAARESAREAAAARVASLVEAEVQRLLANPTGAAATPGAEAPAKPEDPAAKAH